MSRKRIALLLTAILAAIFGLAACGGDDGGDNGDAANGGDDPIVLGFAVAKTGTASNFDLPLTRAAEFAVEDINADGGVLGRQLEIVSSDTRSDAEQGALAAQEVIGNGADFVIVTADFDFGAPAARVAETEGLISYSLGAQSAKFGVQGIGPHAFTIGPPAVLNGVAAAEWASKSKGLKNPYLLVQQPYAFTAELSQGFEWAWGEVAGEDSIAGSDVFEAGDTNFQTQIARIKSASPQPDFIWLPGFAPEAPTLIKQIRAAGIDIPIVSAQALSSPFWLPTVGNLSEFYTVDAGNATGADPDPKVNELVDRVREAVGPDVPIGGNVTFGYSTIQALVKAMENAGSTDTEAVTEALQSFDKEPLLSGPTTYSPEAHITTSTRAVVNQVQNGKMDFAEEWEIGLEPPAEVIGVPIG